MKGKKSDQAFIAQFITESVGQGIATPDKMLARAKTFIAEIDKEIKAIEEKKIIRSKLLDVVEAFEKKEQPDKTEEVKILELFELDYPETCQQICSFINNNDYMKIEELFFYKDDDVTYSQVKFAVKQLLKANILIKDAENTMLIPGIRLPEYMKYVLQNEV